MRWTHYLKLSFFFFMTSLAFFSTSAFAEPKVSPQASSTSFWVSTVIVAYLVITGVEALLKSRGVIQSEADRQIQEIHSKLTSIMPTGVAIEDTVIGKTISRIKSHEKQMEDLHKLVTSITSNVDSMKLLLDNQLDERLINSTPDRLKKIAEVQGETSVQIAKAFRILRVFLRENDYKTLLEHVEREER